MLPSNPTCTDSVFNVNTSILHVFALIGLAGGFIFLLRNIMPPVKIKVEDKNKVLTFDHINPAHTREITPRSDIQGETMDELPESKANGNNSNQPSEMRAVNGYQRENGALKGTVRSYPDKSKNSDANNRDGAAPIEHFRFSKAYENDRLPRSLATSSSHTDNASTKFMSDADVKHVYNMDRKLDQPLPTPIVGNATGIRNLGNTCYLSASVQALFTTPHFLLDLCNIYNANCMKKDMPLSRALLEIATDAGLVPHLSTSDASSVKQKFHGTKAVFPITLKKQIDLKSKKYVGFEQMDAHEFLLDLIDLMHNELTPENDARDGITAIEHKSNGKANVIAKTLLPTDVYFQLKVQVCLECNTCNYSR